MFLTYVYSCVHPTTYPVINGSPLDNVVVVDDGSGLTFFYFEQQIGWCNRRGTVEEARSKSRMRQEGALWRKRVTEYTLLQKVLESVIWQIMHPVKLCIRTSLFSWFIFLSSICATSFPSNFILYIPTLAVKKATLFIFQSKEGASS